MKLKSKLKLYEEFVNENKTNSGTEVAIDQTSATATAGEAIRTEIVKDVDTILNNLIELSDRIGESADIDTQIDELYEALYDTLNVTALNEGILDFIKSPIKYMKIQKNMKAYQKSLVGQAINDVDFAKKKQAADDDGGDAKTKEVLTQANKAKNQALKDEATAISDRMAELSKGDEGLGKVVSLGKTKSKLAAAKMVMKATSGEENKQLKLEIGDLENRIADDEKSLKDYAKAETDKKQPDEVDPRSAEEISKDQLDGPDGSDKGGKKPAGEGEEGEGNPNAEKIAALDTKIDGLKNDKKTKEDQLNSKNHPDVLAVEVAIKSAELEKAKLEDNPEAVASAENALKTAKDDQKAAADKAAADKATPADETPADETPADETPADETPADETPADETPASEPAAEPADDEEDDEDVRDNNNLTIKLDEGLSIAEKFARLMNK